MKIRLSNFIFSALFAIGCGLIGFALVSPYLRALQDFEPFPHFGIVSPILFAALGLIVGFVIGSILYRRISELGKNLKRLPPEDKIAATFGTIISIIPAYLLGMMIYRLLVAKDSGPLLITALILLESVLVIWLSNVVAMSMKDEMKFLVPGMSARSASGASAVESAAAGTSKLLDTNVIIDGRIYDICRSGFMDGTIILPGFVLEELQHIADSADALRRNRGRRGLDILHQMQNELSNPVQVVDRYKVAFAPGDEVDIKLVKLAKGMGADIVTNDFNLNKVAKLHGVRVLNVNELANAVKPVVLPGEELHVNIVREGKEYNQGVGYLDDGTMVVVENGKKMLGDTVTVSVSSVLQTVAGKMIFAELKYENQQEEPNESSSYYSGRGNRRKTY